MRKELLSGVTLTPAMMTPAERAKGRFMRAPDGHDDNTGGGGSGTAVDSTSLADNTGGNSGESSNGDKTGDNTSKTDDLASFWNDKPDDKSKDGESDDNQQSTALGQELKGLIDQHAPAPLFTKEVADQIADGNLEGINAAFQKAQQSALQQSVILSTKLIGAVVGRMEQQFQERIDAALGNKDNQVALETHFPAAKDPAVKPMIEKVFNQALKNTKGNREEAVKQTRGMLEAFGHTTGLTTPPSDPSSTVDNRASQSLVDSLLGRG